MQSLVAPSSVVLPNLNGFHLRQTLQCGQCFRWREISEGVFEGVVRNAVCRASMQGTSLVLDGATEEDFTRVWRCYFDLDTNYDAVRLALAAYPPLADAVRYAGGIRILRQDGWEALATFILSQNNNIVRITGIVARLCETFGQPLPGGYHAFPGPAQLAGLTPEDLAPLRAGFRARYLLDAACRVQSGDVDLTALSSLPLSQARAMLMRIVGVGPKVADCALLFGFYRLECFPVDVWIARALREVLPDGLPASLLPVAGIAQQMLFHYMRTCPERPTGV
ncbi:MAG: DNA glycosylase [Oscillospiraceae bacterium]